YDPTTFEVILLIVKTLYPKVTNDAKVIFYYILSLIEFKYGKYFSILIPFLEFAVSENIKIAQKNLLEWIQDIKSINEFKVRTKYLQEKIFTEKEYRQLQNFVKDKISLPEDPNGYVFKAFITPFYGEYFLLEIQMPTYSLYAFTNQENLIFLTGTYNLYFTTMKDEFRFQREGIEQYVRLFFDSTQGKFGRFIIIEDEEDFKWSTTSSSKRIIQDDLKTII